ncbi:MAG: S8 family peptidase [Clostridia bacterium]|nr:S8 family peptidase [Clostridia bacterium]
MNKNKISPELLQDVSVLGIENRKNIFISTKNFDKTKKFLKDFKYSFIPYRFANCFYVSADIDDISIFSNLDDVVLIQSNAYVQAESKEQDFMNLRSLTEDKYFGQEQTICFIDTGIHPHFDFVLPHSKILKFVDLLNKKSHPYDDNGHGTFVAGIACGNGTVSNNNKGFAPLSNIISIKALGKSGDSNSNVILDAMQWVYENHKVYNISVVCMSFGADCNLNVDPMSSGAEALWKAGITVVAAAGNSGPNQHTIKSPGNNPYIITVGALDVTNMQTANFSSRGPTTYGHKPDLLAPAVDIVSCSNLALPYTKMSGTSVATPIVAAVCAIIKSKYPKMTNNEIKKFLLSHCTKITGNVDIEGAGYLNF